MLDNFEEINSTLALWGKRAVRPRPEIMIAGSPERTLDRAVCELNDGALVVVERIAPQARSLKERIALTLEYLAGGGARVVTPYLRSLQGQYIEEAHGGLWQIVPYVPGVVLDRPAYIFDDWRGEAMARTLLDIYRSAEGLSLFASDPMFSLPEYIDQLMTAIGQGRPDILPRVRVMRAHVQHYLDPFYPKLKGGFCHGDYHPINIIWADRGINAVIDWEFTGRKPELYDAANMVGCLGIEDPECLWSGGPVDFIATLKGQGSFVAESWATFVDLVIALRFAWLSEWLRKRDEEMVEMELDYFDVLSHKRKDFIQLWGLDP